MNLTALITYHNERNIGAQIDAVKNNFDDGGGC